MSPLVYDIIPVTAFQQNCTLLWCRQTLHAAVVDPGGDIDRIEQAVRDHGVKVTQILLTHGHIDHAGGAADLADGLQVPIIGPHGDDLYWIEGLPEQSRMFGLPPARSFIPQRWLGHGDSVLLGEQQLTVRHCPGHTPGHVVFYHAQSNLAITGDVLFEGSIGRTDFPGGSHEALLRSLHDHLLTLPDDVTFLPGHGPSSTIGIQRRTNPYCR